MKKVLLLLTETLPSVPRQVAAQLPAVGLD